ncbi:MAG: hypothetical protein EOO42_00890 [Flavobacteriales bacterium]|nr:MAG: hypothetical protein EOO42_00890 [Flavobacteriales bacterium]
MDTSLYLPQLEAKLRAVGALQPAAWQQIIADLQMVILKPEQHFIRIEGSFAYVAVGILKECDAKNRKQPSVINFIATNEPFVTRKLNKANYLVACTKSIVFYWNLNTLQNLYQEFRELKHSYDILCAEYDASIELRQLILEAEIPEKIILFTHHFKSLRFILLKKDIANYLHISYTHYVSISNNRP